MKKIAILSVAAALLTGALAGAQAPEKDPEKWVQQLVGEWESEAKLIFDPGQPPVESKGTESVRSVGGWVLAETKANTPAGPMTGIMTVGYDPEKKHFVGTWIDSMTQYLWNYKGTLDATGKILTLEADGPNPADPGKLGKFRDVIEVKSKDHKVLTASMQGPDGRWQTFMTVNYRRTK
jgi:hypothetical protein